MSKSSKARTGSETVTDRSRLGRQDGPAGSAECAVPLIVTCHSWFLSCDEWVMAVEGGNVGETE